MVSRPVFRPCSRWWCPSVSMSVLVSVTVRLAVVLQAEKVSPCVRASMMVRGRALATP